MKKMNKNIARVTSLTLYESSLSAILLEINIINFPKGTYFNQRTCRGNNPKTYPSVANKVNIADMSFLNFICIFTMPICN